MKRILALVVAVIAAEVMATTTPVVVSSQLRADDPTILDVVYKVTSDEASTVNVRALAFEDGERSFQKVIRPETFIDGTAANIGDGIAANVEHKLAWKVSSDWKTDLAKVKFEILISDEAQLPLDTVTIPEIADKSSSLTVSVNPQNDADIFNALMWHYANAAADLEIRDGNLYRTTGSLLASRASLGSANRATVLSYLYDKMGWELLANVTIVDFVKKALRNADMKDMAITKGSLAEISVYIGEKTYWAIDLETGASEYFDSMPLVGWGNEYKTTKLLMRRVEPGTVNMLGRKQVTITKPFYIGVFEVTQKQYTLINGSNPSQFKGDMRPVEYVSYCNIRGTNKGVEWPNGTEFDDTSWLGKLKAKVGIAFDLPTEAQWEYACRAGTTSAYNNGGSSESDLRLLGRYQGNCNDGKGGYSVHTTVGSYQPNAWGLYDMHGNVWEWCLDYYEGITYEPATDYHGSVGDGNRDGHRARRGGCWNNPASYCVVTCRVNDNPATEYSNGFRLVRPIQE